MKKKPSSHQRLNMAIMNDYAYRYYKAAGAAAWAAYQWLACYDKRAKEEAMRLLNAISKQQY